MIKKLILFVLFSILAGKISSQEFLCKVQIQYPSIQGVDPSVFDAMKQSIFEFMNNRRWSDLNLEMEERIECTFVITITQATQGGDEFAGSMNIVLQRPIFGTSYNSPLLNMVDDNINFTYTTAQPFEYSDNAFNDNLTSILAFYAYLMLGVELDTYARYQGTAFYQKALAVATTAQSANEPGWQPFDNDKNRVLYVENMLNQTYQAQRDFLYEYHRLGLDVMSENVETGRKAILKSLVYLQKVYDLRPLLYSLQVELQAKRQEIINVFSEATPAEKIEMLNIMKEIDPPNGSMYEAVMKK